MPQTIVETANYSKPRKCDTPVSNFVTLGKGDESPGSDSSLNGLFINGVLPKSKQWGQISYAGRETVDKNENSRLNHINDLYSDYDFLNGCQINSPNKSFDSKNMGIGNDTDSDILGDFSDLLSSINSANSVAHGVAPDCKSYLDCFHDIPSSTNKRENAEPEILDDFADLLSSITSPNKVSDCVSSNPNSHRNVFHATPSYGPDFNVSRSSFNVPNGSLKSKDSSSQNNGTLSDILSSISLEENDSTHDRLNSSEFCKSSSCIPNGNSKSDDSNPQNNVTLSDILSSISLDENNSTLDKLNSTEFCKSSSCIPNGSPKPEDSNSQNNVTLSDILSSISLDENNSTLNGPKSSNSKLFFEDFEVASMDRSNPEFSEMSPNSPAVNSKSRQSKLKSSILNPNSDLCHEDIKVGYADGHNFYFMQTNSGSQNCTLSDFLSSISPLKDNADKEDLTASNSIPKSNNQDAFLDTWLDFNNDNHKTQTSGISVPQPSSLKSSMHNQKNEEFSFFSVSPENVFSDMVSKLKNDADKQGHSTESDTAGITMLDLFKSVNSNSSSSLSEYLSSESESSLNGNNTTETVQDLCEIMDIDLSSCVKTNDDSLNSISSAKCQVENTTYAFENERNGLPLQSFMIRPFPENECLKRPRMNLKQSLFAKSLSCKLKKNPIVLQKVAKIKSELFKKYFNCPLPNIEAKKSIVKNSIIDQSNNCMITFHGHRICTDKGLEDVKCT